MNRIAGTFTFLISLLFSAQIFAQGSTYFTNTEAQILLQPEYNISDKITVFGRIQKRNFLNTAGYDYYPYIFNRTSVFGQSIYASLALGLQYQLSEKIYLGGQIDKFKNIFYDDFNNFTTSLYIGHIGGKNKLKFHKQLIYNNIIKRTSNNKDIYLGANFGVSLPLDLGILGVLQPGISLQAGNYLYYGNIKTTKLVNSLVPQATLGWQGLKRLNLNLAFGWDRFSYGVEFGKTKYTNVNVKPYLRASLGFSFGKITETKIKNYSPWGYKGYMQRF